MSDDRREFEEWARIFLNKDSAKIIIEQNIAANKALLGLDIVKVKRFLGKEQYFKAGEELGTMLVIVTTPSLSSDYWLQ
jgi:hypothetical protein